jgi:hypothetical protein
VSVTVGGGRAVPTTWISICGKGKLTGEAQAARNAKIGMRGITLRLKVDMGPHGAGVSVAKGRGRLMGVRVTVGCGVGVGTNGIQPLA